MVVLAEARQGVTVDCQRGIGRTIPVDPCQSPWQVDTRLRREAEVGAPNVCETDVSVVVLAMLASHVDTGALSGAKIDNSDWRMRIRISDVLLTNSAVAVLAMQSRVVEAALEIVSKIDRDGEEA